MDIIVAHKGYEREMLAEIVQIGWRGLSVPCLPPGVLAALKRKAGGRQDILDAEALEALPTADSAEIEKWRKRLHIKRI